MRTYSFLPILLASVLAMIVTPLLQAQWGGPGGLTNDPNPGGDGVYDVCVHDYDFSSNPDQWWKGRIYVPVRDRERCETGGPFPLVLISHADFSVGVSLEEAHLQYDALARHLASHAIVVVSLNRYRDRTMGGAIDHFKDVLLGHLGYLYGPMSPIPGLLTDDVGIIGHSAGGRSVTRHADQVNLSGHHLRALAVLAPTIDFAEKRTFSGVADAFLGMHGRVDRDASAFGSKFDDAPMSSTFKLYDDAGETSRAGIRTITKDMIFLESHSHYFQNSPEALAYINAFMQLNVNGHTIFNRYLKYQETPPTLKSIGSRRWQQHADMNTLMIANFENGNANSHYYGGPIDYSTPGISDEEVDFAFIIDDFSPHQTRVLKFHWEDQSRVLEFVRFGFNGGENFSHYRNLSFRMTQVFNLDDNSIGDDIQIRVVLETAAGESSVDLDDFGGDLHFTVRDNWNPPIGDQPEATKNAMRSYLIPLWAFGRTNLNQVTAIRFDFVGPSGADTYVIMDDLEFTL